MLVIISWIIKVCPYKIGSCAYGLSEEKWIVTESILFIKYNKPQ